MSESKQKLPLSMSRVYYHASENLRGNGLTEEQIAELLTDLRNQVEAPEVLSEFCEQYSTFERLSLLGLEELLYQAEDDICYNVIEEEDKIKHLIMVNRVHSLSSSDLRELWKKYSVKKVWMVVSSKDYDLTAIKVFSDRSTAEQFAKKEDIVIEKVLER